MPRSTENTKACNFGWLSFQLRIIREKKKANRRIICIPQLQLLLHQPQCWGQVGRINFTTCYKAHTPAKRLHLETISFWDENGKKAALFLVSDIRRSVNRSVSQLHSHFFTANLQVKDTFPSWAEGGSSLEIELHSKSEQGTHEEAKPVWQRATIQVCHIMHYPTATYLGWEEGISMCHSLSSPDTDTI